MPDRSTIPETTLPSDAAVLQGMNRELLATVDRQLRRIGRLEHQLDQLLKRYNGPRADRIHRDQSLLFEEPPAPEPQFVIVEPLRESPPAAKPRGHGRRTLPANLRREIVVVDISDADNLAVGGRWTQNGEEVSEKLDYTPSSLFVRRIVRPKYVVRFESKPDELKIADLPPEAMPKSKAAPGLVADVVVSKCVDHLPLYRQEQRYARQGVELSRSTLCGWLAEAADVLTPLYLLLKARVLTAKAVHTDDTPIPVQDPEREHCRTGRILANVSNGDVFYDATEDRCRDGPLQFLKDFRGTLQCYAYAGYDELFRTTRGGSSSRPRRPVLRWSTKPWPASGNCMPSRTKPIISTR